jgi:hypothetical protein
MTMKRKLAVLGLASIALIVVGLRIQSKREPIKMPTPAAPSPVDLALKAAKARQDFVDGAEGACLSWTESNSPMRVDVSSANQTVVPDANLKPNQLRIRTAFRAGADGVVMVSECKVSQAAGGYWLDSARILAR